MGGQDRKMAEEGRKRRRRGMNDGLVAKKGANSRRHANGRREQEEG